MAPADKPELLSSGAGLGAAVAVESGTELGELGPVRARGYWEQVWRRFRRDKAAIISGAFIIFLLLAAYPGAALASLLLGHGPNDIYGTNGLDPNTLLPVGPFSHVQKLDGSGTSLFVLGSDSQLGRDEFLRLLYGARVSLEVAIGATILGMSVGVVMGAIAGYFGGWTDTVVSRTTEIVMAFPVLLFIIALASTVGDRLNHVTFGFLQPGVFTLTVVIGVFGWYYPARIIRAVVLSLREKEFVEAARMIGASDARIIRSHLVPHLVAPIIVYSTLIIAQNVLLEAGLSFLGIGIPLDVPSWGNLLSTAPDYYLAQPWLMIWPGLALLITTLAFNLLGDGLRDSFDPRAAH
jgi:ABC-type dipeptide/oligopeptide/nickel transport system permease subunit